MKVVHHNDMDGRCAGFIVKHFVQMASGSIPSPEFIEMDYDRKFPFEQVGIGERVFIVDFSLELEGMKKLLQITDDVHWIDHHGSSIRKYDNWDGKEIKGLRDEGAAGCVLTYKYCYRLFKYKRARYVPIFIQLIGDRDIWAWKYGQRTKLFHRGLLAEDTSPESDVWYDAWKATGKFERNGVPIERAFAQQAQEIFKRGGFWTEFCGHKCFVVNSTLQSSEYFEQFVPDATVWISFRYTQGCWSVSLYSLQVDVSKIAEKFAYNGRRGGGHKGAAGFTCYYPPFLTSARDVAKTRLQREVDEL